MNRIERSAEISKRVQALAKLDPFVVCTLQGRDFKLEFDNTAIKAVLTELGMNLLKDGLDRAVFEDIEKTTQLFYIGIQKHNNPKPAVTGTKVAYVSIDDLNSYLGIKHFPYIMRCLIDAVDGYYPEIGDLPKIGADGEILDPQ